MTVFRQLTRNIVLLGAISVASDAALACRQHKPNPDENQLAKLPADHVGTVGKVVRSYFNDETKSDGEAVVLVEILKAFGKDAPTVGEQIFILNAGCCVCEGISTNPGDIVHAGLVGFRGWPYKLSWPRL